MKFLIYTLFIFNFINAQNKESLITLTKEYQSQYCEKNIEKILFYTFPKVFDVVSYDLLKEQLEDHFDNDQMKVRYLNYDSEVKLSSNFSNSTYHFIKATFDIKLNIKYKYEIEDAQETIIDFINKVIKPKEIIYNNENQSFTIIKSITILGITELQYPDHWRFINLERDKFVLNLLFENKDIEKINLL